MKVLTANDLKSGEVAALAEVEPLIASAVQAERRPA